MSSSLHNFALAWNLRLCFFLNPSTSPRFWLNWNHHNVDGTHFVLGYGVENFHTPYRFFHKHLETVSLELYSGPVSDSQGVALVLISYPLPIHPVFNFQARIKEYPQEWLLEDITHQHLLTCAWLRFWYIEEKGPAQWPIWFFKLMLNMEHTLFWLSHLGFWVAWSMHYDQLLEWLFPAVLSDFPPTQHQVEFTHLHTHLFFSRHPSLSLPESVQSSITLLDTLMSIAHLCLIPWDGSGSYARSGFQPDPSSNIMSACGATVRVPFSGVLEYLHELVSTDRHWVSPEEFVPPGYFLVGEELDLELAAAGLSPSDFLGATLPLPWTIVMEEMSPFPTTLPWKQERPHH
ncbi:hypothetical protein DFH08DRAFT_817186 [Mycena albidolilacea]|uniref:Uncharacterized protein n=1 Tax=Mycena albidolilacea TaxID=1033008 RepID=A0AAD6ZJH4_9AGAR|nr:hypothetical protein DFH08DRAFT_817186 [Mycena albidolilacea]